MKGVLLDKHGRPKMEPPFDKPGVLYAYAGDDYTDAETPDHIKRNLDKAAEVAGPFEPRNSLQTWEETLLTITTDGATITASATESLLVPLFTLPANYLYPGRTLKWTVCGRQSTAITTPGTITLKVAYSATGLGAVTQVTSGAFAPDPTAAATTLTWMMETYTVCRTAGTAGTGMTIGRVDWSDFDDASAAALVGNLNMTMLPPATPATAVLNTTVASGLMPTYTSSVSTASCTAHIGLLEALT